MAGKYSPEIPRTINVVRCRLCGASNRTLVCHGMLNGKQAYACKDHGSKEVPK